MVKPPLSVAEYLASEKSSEVRHEYVEGELLAMAGETREHYRIARNITRALEDGQTKPNCEVVMEAIKLRVGENRYRYPDVVVSCDPGSDPYFIENPCFIVEVLSDSTSETDTGKKLEEYTRLSSLQTYVIVAQSEPRVIVYKRDALGWRVEILQGQGELEVSCLGAALSLEQIYSGIVFDSIHDQS